MANCNERENWIETSSHSYRGIPLTLWLLLLDDVTVFSCTWRSRGWSSNEKAWCRGIVCCSKEFHICYPDWRLSSWTRRGALDDTDCTPWTLRRWSELTPANWKPRIQIPKENVLLIDYQWTEKEQAKLNTLVETSTSQCASGECRVYT